MYGDGAHKKILDAGWKWDGREYARYFDGVILYLWPWPGNGPLQKLRINRWVLSVAKHGGEREAVAGYPNINTAAMAAGGVE